MDIQIIKKEFEDKFGISSFSREQMWLWIETKLTGAASEVNVERLVKKQDGGMPYLHCNCGRQMDYCLGSKFKEEEPYYKCDICDIKITVTFEEL